MEQLCCFGADGDDDESLSERGESRRRGKGRDGGWRVGVDYASNVHTA